MADLERSNRLFKTFADPTRLRILNLLREGELCVCHLNRILDVPQSRVSRHLAYLKRAGLIVTREERTWNYYRLAQPMGRLEQRLLGCLAECLVELPQLRHDRRQLARLRIPA